MVTLDNTLRDKADPEAILRAIVDRLRDKVAVYNEQNCGVSDQPVPTAFPGGRELCTVSFGGGSFPSEFFAGAGTDTMTVDGSVIICPMVSVRLDKAPWKADSKLMDDARGLLTRQQQIFWALFHDDAWEPASGAQPLLRDLLSPRRITPPGSVQVGESEMLAVQIHLGTVFDWDLAGGGL